jgi:glycosyltransferase involved in cell wall biosynthesis
VRLALLHNIISPHVVPLFQLLSRDPDVDLTVYFFSETDVNRRWETTIGDRFRYRVLPHLALRTGRTDLYTYFINPTVVSALLRDGFDALISVGWDSFAALAAFCLCKLKGRPYILWSGSTAYEPSWRRTLTLPLVRTIVRGSDGYVAYGSRARDYLVSLGANREKIAIAYNTVDVAWYQSQAEALRPHRENIRREIGLGLGPAILYVGRLVEGKGVRDLIEAFRQVRRARPDTQLLLVGYGPLEEELRGLISDTHLEGVVMPGHVPIPQLPRFYVAADCFVLPSHAEIWGLVLNEAAAFGLPLITTDRVGGGPDLIEPGVNGFIVPVGSPGALAEAMVQALDRGGMLGRESLRVIRRATYAQNVAAVMGLLRRLSANGPHGPYRGTVIDS